MSLEYGTVAWFDFKRGFGFIRCDSRPESDAFVHHSNIAVGKPGYRTLDRDTRVEFEPVVRNGKLTALNVRPVSPESGAAQ